MEINRPSYIFMKARREGEKVLNVRVGGNAVEIAEGEYSLSSVRFAVVGKFVDFA